MQIIEKSITEITPRLSDNKVGEVAEWDFDLLDDELDGIFDIDMSEFGFDIDLDIDQTGGKNK